MKMISHGRKILSPVPFTHHNQFHSTCMPLKKTARDTSKNPLNSKTFSLPTHIKYRVFFFEINCLLNTYAASNHSVSYGFRKRLQPTLAKNRFRPLPLVHKIEKVVNHLKTGAEETLATPSISNTYQTTQSDKKHNTAYSQQ